MTAIITTPDVKVTFTERTFDPTGPRGTSVAYVEFSPGQVPMDRPDYDDDEAWTRYNALELDIITRGLELAAPVIDRETTGQPGTWTHSRYAGCTVCPCTPGMVAQRRLIRENQIVDVTIEFVS